MKLGVPPGAATHKDICVKVAIGAGMTESVPSGPRGSSISPAEGRTTNGGSLLGTLHQRTGAEAAGEAHCSCSKAP